MRRVNYVSLLCFLISLQNVFAAEETTEDIDEDFLEILGSFETENEDDDWHEVFWSTMDEEFEQAINDE